MSEEGNININDDMKLTVSPTTKVMFFPGGEREELNVKIEADFKDLKAEHHQIFLQSFSSKYNHHTHTNYDGSEVPTVVGKVVERKPLWKQIRELFKPKRK